MLRVSLIRSGLILLSVLVQSATTRAELRTAYVKEASVIETEELDLSAPAGLAFAAAAGSLLTVTVKEKALEPEAAAVTMVSFFEEASTVDLAPPVAWDPANMAFDNQSNTLFFFDGANGELLAIPSGAEGWPEPARLTRVEAGHFGLQTAQGMTFDPAGGRLYLLDNTGPAVVVVDPVSQPGLDKAVALRDGQISRLELAETGLGNVRGIAFNPTTNHLYLLNPQAAALYELTTAGQLVAVGDLSAFNLVDPQGMVFAPSRDQTDDPAQLSLYIADSGHRGRIVEFSLAASPRVLLKAASASATLIQTIHTSQFSPPSPDPAGVAYLPAGGTLLISDSEVNEMPIFTGDNLFEASLSGTLVDTLTTLPFSDEPSGIDVNPVNRHLFISDDTGTRSVYELNPGPDGLYDTADDIVTLFRTADFGSRDPEGVTYAIGLDILFIADGVNREIYRVAPGANGIFDGVPPAGDDQVSHFDTLSLGLDDPEGIVFNPDTGTLYAVGDPADTLFELTTGGALVQTIDISAANARKPAGLAYRRISQSEARVYIADRGVDNDSDPNENDGKVYEFSLTLAPTASPTPTATASPTPTNTATGTATFTPTPTHTSTATPTATGTKIPSPSPSPTTTGPAVPGEEETTLFFPVIIQH